MPQKYYVISHTHWDREWYYPFEKFRLRLVSAIDELINIIEKEPSYTFYFDAQAAVIEDYLEIRPENEKKIKRLIKNGNIVIGPWYIQNDFYLSSGEITIRNLIYGIKKSVKFGKCDMVGYAPDQFGNISQLPQLLREFGINSFVFGRGFAKFFINEKGELDRVPPPLEFEWIAPDGSGVTAFYLVQWYNNAQRISSDGKQAASDMEMLGRGLAGLSKLPYRLLMNGVDHLEPQNDLLECLKNASPYLKDGDTAVQAKMHDYVNDAIDYIKKNKITLPTERGELRYGGDYDVLRGCYSSRIKLKQLNSELTGRVERILEPFASMLEISGFKGIYPKDELDYVWKLLLHGVTHDAICGCSSDETCRHLLDRYARIDEVTDFLLKSLAEKSVRSFLSDFADDDTFVIFCVNTLSTKYDDVIDLVADLPDDFYENGFDLFSCDGEKFDYVITATRKHKADVISPLNLPMSVPATECKLSLKVKIPPYSFYPIYVKKKPENELKEKTNCGFKKTNGIIENEFYRISFKPNSVVFTDKRSGKTLENFITITDEADAGDAYVFNGAGEDVLTFSPCKASGEIINLGGKPLISCIIVDFKGKIPSGYDFNEKRRKTETNEFRAQVTIELKSGSDIVKIDYTLFNPSEDHRMKLKIKTGITAKEIYSDIPFDISVSDGSHFDPRTKDKAIYAQSFAFVKNTSEQAAVINHGNCDYSLEKDGDITVTLVRSTGVISRLADFSPNGDVWESAKENQQKGELNGVLGYLRTNKELTATEISRKAERFLYPPYFYFTSANEARLYSGNESLQTTTVKGKFFKNNPYKDVKPKVCSPVVYLRGDVETSALKKSEKGDGVVLRLFNRAGKSERISVDVPGKKISRVNMSEKRKYGGDAERFESNVLKGKIVTLKITDK
ncbi:MAG: glycoside hydrolase family 38 C-terminal domain-containing protein [bacterium]|nr:glycoside hydrolase family 38 C-terminal domain-containing protein [bacterium]